MTARIDLTSIPQTKGRDDAETYLAETDPGDWARAIAPGAEDASDGLINALGFCTAARELGIATDTAYDRREDMPEDVESAALAAMAAYSAAWRATVEAAISEAP